MCGIAGIYYRQEQGAVAGEAARRMQEAMRHRGPDDAGIQEADRRLTLVNTRLAIMDLSAQGHQPMANASRTVWVSFNGEIYNFRQLRAQLQAEGVVFCSGTDTEVLVSGYERWGIETLLCRLRGMFAFAVYDCRQQPARLILVRDRLGIKPLYVYSDEEKLLFASEVRTLRSSGLVSPDRCAESTIAFLLFGHLPEPMTTLRNVTVLPAGHYLLVQEGRQSVHAYYRLRDAFRKSDAVASGSQRHALARLLGETVDLHLISDAPIGVFLSGGLDSSALAAFARHSGVPRQPVVTLSVTFEEKGFDESPFQQAVAGWLKTDHRQVRVGETDFFSQLDAFFRAMDQPTVDGVNTYFISAAARRAGLKAVLSGVGADELFYGYPAFQNVSAIRHFCRLPRWVRAGLSGLPAAGERLRKLRYLRSCSDLAVYLSLRGLFWVCDVARLLDADQGQVERVMESFAEAHGESFLSRGEPREWFSYMELSYYMRNQLLKDTDAFGMSQSVEIRVPYLDHVFLGAACALPSRLKKSGNIPKALLFSLAQQLLPPQIGARSKQGFTFPFAVWLRQKGGERLRGLLAKAPLERTYTKKLFDAFMRGQIHWSRVWAAAVIAENV